MHASPEVHIVDNRVFLLGLDELYRSAMKRIESVELLACAREVALMLHVKPANEPVEGYYAEDKLLTEYFQLMRALQAEPNGRAAEVEKLRAYERLYEVTSSPLFGRPREEDKLLPTGQDALTEALEKTSRSDLTIRRVTARAEQAARAMDDYSLVGLAARTKDAVVLTALRESVVLYARVVFLAMSPGGMPRQVYEWHVDPQLAKQADRFIRTFNTLFSTGEPLPEAVAKNARVFWGACDLTRIVGRCVRIGYDDTVRPIEHYHWALKRPGGQLEVEEFWAPEIWTTERYRRERLHQPIQRGGQPPLLNCSGTPPL